VPPVLAALVGALLWALLGVAFVALGNSSRRLVEPEGLVAGPGLLVGVEGPMDFEVRGRPLTQPSAEGRRAGGVWRGVGVGLLAFALARLALRPSVRRGRTRWLRIAWCLPGVLGLVEIAVRAGARAPTTALAEEHFVNGLLLYGLSAVLLVSWRS